MWATPKIVVTVITTATNTKMYNKISNEEVVDGSN